MDTLPVMGSTTFTLPKSLPPAAARLLERACFAGGYDQTPVPTRAKVTGDCLHLTRELSESGYLLVPWPIEPFGTFVVTTTTIRERDEPYLFLIELARGKLNQVRTQAADWQALGLKTPPEFDRELASATRLFGKAVLEPDIATAEAGATRVLQMAFALADQLARIYTQQLFALRLSNGQSLRSHLTARLTRVPTAALAADYQQTFSAVRVGVRWSDLEPVEAEFDWEAVDAAVEYAASAGLTLSFGPLIDLAPGMLPPWAAGWHGDLPTLAAFMGDYVETVLTRYRKAIPRWVICSGFNHADSLGLSDDDRLRLAARLFEVAHQVDPRLELVLGIAQPWGDYLTHDDQTISPFSFADDLLRSGAKLGALELELRMGTTPRGSWPRDLLDTSRLLDTFGLLGVPLDVMVSIPASGEADAQAAAQGETRDGAVWRAAPTAEGQAEWGAALVELALCKTQVQTVTWDHLHDADPHLTPHGGLIDPQGGIRPLFNRLRAIRTSRLR